MVTVVRSNPIRPSQRPHCYICASEKNLTDDHVPPKGFFPPDDRKNLITAPLCENCHRPLKNTDEAMRVWVAAGAAGSSDVGAWIWKHKVLGSTFKRSPKLRENIKKYLQQMVIETEDGLLTRVDVLKMPQGRAIPFIRRLTKGLLYHFHPEYDYFADSFSVIYRLPTKEVVECVTDLAKKLPRYDVGRGVFSVWHGIPQDAPTNGAWIYLFYNAVCFVCFHGQGDTFPQPDIEDGYVEETGLPPQL